MTPTSERQYSLAVESNAAEAIRLAYSFRVEAITAEFLLAFDEGNCLEAVLLVGNRKVFDKVLAEPRGKSFAVFPPRLPVPLYIPAGVPIELKSKGGACRLLLNGFQISFQTSQPRKL